MSKDIIIKDEKGREIIRMRNGQIAINRYSDMDEKTKEYVIDVWSETTKECPKKLKDFLDYKSEENEFCS